jgi:hypothetical protein
VAAGGAAGLVHIQRIPPRSGSASRNFLGGIERADAEEVGGESVETVGSIELPDGVQ